MLKKIIFYFCATALTIIAAAAILFCIFLMIKYFCYWYVKIIAGYLVIMILIYGMTAIDDF